MGQDETTKRPVFVLGAGFTKAFVPGAPLLVDDYPIKELLEQFRGFEHAARVLEFAAAGGDSKVDLEALLTRLSGMPYDSREALREFAVLESALQDRLLSRIQEAKAGGVEKELLAGFARFLLKSRANVVTFNYDDVLDQSLWEVRRYAGGPARMDYWHPDGGYGFYCRPSSVSVTDRTLYMDQPSTLVLKLHGSMNWRSRLGEPPARGPSALLHHEKWLGESNGWHQSGPTYTLEEIEKYLEPEPFIVPPVLIKTGLSLHPVLRVIWEAAYKVLSRASQVVFIGYSVPETDLVARTLFRETLDGRRDVELHVVNWADADDSKARLRAAYGKVLRIPDECFDFSGARCRIERDFSESDAETSG